MEKSLIQKRMKRLAQKFTELIQSDILNFIIHIMIKVIIKVILLKSFDELNKFKLILFTEKMKV